MWFPLSFSPPPSLPAPQREVRSSQQIVFSEYLQMLTALAVGLGLHTVLTSPPHPPHFTPPPPARQWNWLGKFSQVRLYAYNFIRWCSLIPYLCTCTCCVYLIQVQNVT